MNNINELIPDSLTWNGETYKVEKPITIKGGWINVENKGNVSEIPLQEADGFNEIARLQNVGISMANDIERKRQKIRLLKKALTRLIAEFDTITPVIPNQQQALQFANNLLKTNDE